MKSEREIQRAIEARASEHAVRVALQREGYQMSETCKDYFAVEEVIQEGHRQLESVKGKDTPFRVEFRYRRGRKSWQYFEDLESARKASDRKAGYSPTGWATIEHPLSQVIQVRGPRGGWGISNEQ